MQCQEPLASKIFFFPASKYCKSVVYGSLAGFLLYGFLDSKDLALFWSRVKIIPAALWPMGSPHHSWLASGLASSIECWCHPMALPHFWVCLSVGHSPSFVGLAIGFIILVILVRHGAQLQPCFILPMVGKGCIHFSFGPTEELVELVVGWPELQPLAAIMFHNQGRWDGNCFGAIAADGGLALDFNIHGCQLEQYLLSQTFHEPARRLNEATWACNAIQAMGMMQSHLAKLE